MSKNIENTVSKRGRGRPHKTLALPESGKFTLTEIMALNPGIARLTIYNQIKDGTLAVKATKETAPTGKPGKPGVVYITLAAWKHSQASKKAAATRKKLVNAPPVDLTPEEAPTVVPVETPVAEVEQPVAVTVNPEPVLA
jgi:hypothetical protein